MSHSSARLLLLLPIFAACDRAGAAADPGAAPSTALAPAAPRAAAAATAPSGSPDSSPPPGSSIAAQLQREAAGRPPIAPRAEELLAALDRAGVDLEPPRQVVGLTVRAAYCVSTRAAAGLGVAICEYPDAAAAAAGRQYSLDHFQALQPDRRIEIKGALTLTLTLPHGADADAAARAATLALARL
jgi:hypothetical protein